MDARRALFLLRRWWPLLVAGTLIAVGAAYAVSKTLPKLYEATALLRVNPGLGTVGGGLDFNEVQASWSQAAADAQLIHTTPIAQAAITRVAGRVQHPVDAGTLLKDSAATAAPQSPIVSLVVRAGNPNDASLLANAMASAFIARDAQTRTAGFASALDEINRQLRFYGVDNAAAQSQIERPSPRSGTRSAALQAQSSVPFQHTAVDQGMLWQLQNEALGIRLRLAGAGTTLSLAQPATPTPDVVSPRTAVNTLLAGVLALLVLLGVALLADLVDNRPRSDADVAAALDVPLLGTIGPAPQGSPALLALEQPASVQADDYRTLRANLGLVAGADADSTPARVIAITGVRPGDGATTVAANLATIAARAGMRVTLVDANLRRPALHGLFGLPDRAGLTAALRDRVDPLPLQDSSVAGLRVLVAGRAPADVIDLLGSPRMRDVLAALRAGSDVVVVDAATCTGADAAVVGALADATLVVARLHGADQAALAGAGRQLRLAGAHPVGAAVTCFVPPSAPRRAARRGAAPSAAEVEPSGRPGLHGAK